MRVLIPVSIVLRILTAGGLLPRTRRGAGARGRRLMVGLLLAPTAAVVDDAAPGKRDGSSTVGSRAHWQRKPGDPPLPESSDLPSARVRAPELVARPLDAGPLAPDSDRAGEVGGGEQAWGVNRPPFASAVWWLLYCCDAAEHVAATIRRRLLASDQRQPDGLARDPGSCAS